MFKLKHSTNGSHKIKHSLGKFSDDTFDKIDNFYKYMKENRKDCGKMMSAIGKNPRKSSMVALGAGLLVYGIFYMLNRK